MREQINLALQIIKPIIEGNAKSFMVREDITNKYNTWLQGRLSRSVWTECISYYQAGRNSKTRITATFPGPVTLFWWLARKPRWEEFEAVGAERWVAQRRFARVKSRVLLFFLVPLIFGCLLKDTTRAVMGCALSWGAGWLEGLI